MVIGIGSLWLLIVVIKLFGGLQDISWSVIFFWPVVRWLWDWVVILLAILAFLFIYKYFVEPDFFGPDFWMHGFNMISYNVFMF